MTAPDDLAEDEMLDRLDAGLPAASPEEQASRAPYERLRARVRALPTAKAPPGMRDRVRAQWKSERAAQRRRRRGLLIGGGVAALAVAAIALLLWPGEADPHTHLAIAVVTPDGVVRRGTAAPAVGDVFQVRGREGRVHTEIRVYAKGKLLARCPGDARCNRLDLDLPLTVPGTYRVLWLSHDRRLPDPHLEGYDGDVAEAQARGVEIERSPVVHVNP